MATASHSWATSATPTLSAQPLVGAPTTVQATLLVVTIGATSRITSIGDGLRQPVRVEALHERRVRVAGEADEGRTAVGPATHLGERVLRGLPEHLLGGVLDGRLLQEGVVVVHDHPRRPDAVGLRGDGPRGVRLLGHRADDDLLPGLDVDAHPHHEGGVLLQQQVVRLAQQVSLIDVVAHSTSKEPLTGGLIPVT